MAVVSAASFLDSGSANEGDNFLTVGFDTRVFNGDTISSFILQRAGADHLLTNADPGVRLTAATMRGNQTILEFPPLEEDLYRLTVLDSIMDANGSFLDGDADGVAGGNWTKDFVVNKAMSGVQPVSIANQVSSVSNTVEETGRLRQISDDGNRIVFASKASNLVLGDTNEKIDIFVRDFSTNQTWLVSSSTSGVQSNGDNSDFTISGNGRFVAFVSQGTNLIDGRESVAGAVYVKDLLLGSLYLASSPNIISDSQPGSRPSLNYDGRYISFQSNSDSIAPGDNNGASDIFVRDVQTGVSYIVSTSSQSQLGSGSSFDAQLSDNGESIVFASSAENLVSSDTNQQTDIFIKHLLTGTIEIVSTDSSGNASDGWSESPSVSADGRFVAFKSFAKNLSPADTQNFSDVYLKDMQTGSLKLVSSNSNGIVGDYFSSSPMISSNGRYVVFASGAGNLADNDFNSSTDIFVKDIQTGSVSRVSSAQSLYVGSDSVPSITAAGNFVAFGTAESLVAIDRRGNDTYRRNMLTGSYAIATQIDPLATNATGNGDSYIGSLSGDGSVVAFDTFATNLGSKAVGIEGQVYARIQGVATGQLISENAMGIPAIGNSRNPSVSGNGVWISFESNAYNLISNDNNGQYDIYVKNRNTGSIERVSTTNDGAESSGYSFDSSISGDGRFVAFISTATEFDSADQNGTQDVYVKDRMTNRIVRASANATGASADSFSQSPKMSSSGQFVTFSSAATNLVAGDDNNQGDIFVKNLGTGESKLASANASGIIGNQQSFRSSISADGRFVIFESDATNLISGDTNDRTDIYRKDMLTGAIERVSTASDGSQANDDSYNATVSDDGRFVLFVSQATNLGVNNAQQLLTLFRKDMLTGTIQPVLRRGDGGELATEVNFLSNMSGDGMHAVVSYAGGDAFSQDRNGFQDIFQLDFNTSPATSIGDGQGRFIEIDTAGVNVGSIIQGPSNAFDSYNRLTVDDTLYAANTPSTTSANGQVVATPLATLSNLAVRRQVYVSSSTPVNLIRTMDEFSNPTSGPIQVTVGNFGNLGSDNKTVVFATSDGDNLVESTDAWIATDDSDPTGGTPAILHYMHSIASPAPNAVSLLADNLSVVYSLTVEAGKTLRVATFALLGASRTEVLAAANSIESTGILSTEAAKYLTESELDSIVNFPNGTLTISTDKQSIRENAGLQATSVTITRSGKNNSDALFVLIQNSDPTEATVPINVTIPAGLDSVTLWVDAKDDTLLDGPVPITLNAAAVGYVPATTQIVVTDFESLDIKVEPGAIGEKAGVTSLTVTRLNTDISNSVSVQLESDPPSSLALPSFVNIPAGQQSFTLMVSPIDNQLFDGDRNVVILATSNGYQSSSVPLTIIDDESLKPGTNPVQPMDVNNDSHVDPLDVLNLVNLLNSEVRPFPIKADGYFYDVDGDLVTSPLDVLTLINYLTSFQRLVGEGESAEGPETSDWQNSPTNKEAFSVELAVDYKIRDDLFSAFELDTWYPGRKNSKTKLARNT